LTRSSPDLGLSSVEVRGLKPPAKGGSAAAKSAYADWNIAITTPPTYPMITSANNAPSPLLGWAGAPCAG